MIVFAGFAKVLRRLSVMTFSAKQFAFFCETFTVIVNIYISGEERGLISRTAAGNRAYSNGFFCETVCFSL